MAYILLKKKRKGMRRRRGYRRRGSKRYTTKINNSNSGPIPNRYSTKIKYADCHSMGLAAGSSNAIVYRANGLYDPYLTGTGHQPYGFDTLMSLWQTFKVKWCSIEVSFANQDTAATAACNVGIVPIYGSSTARTTPGSYREYPNCVWKVIAPSCGVWKIRSFVDIRRITGTPVSDFDVNFQGTAAGDPAEQVYWHIFAEPVNGTADITNVSISVNLVYYTEFFEPVTLGQS